MNHGASGIGVAAASLKNILLGLLSGSAYAIPLTLLNLGAFGTSMRSGIALNGAFGVL